MKSRNFYIFLFLGLLAFGLDLLTPRGAGVWAAYILLLVFYVRFAFSNLVFPLSGIYAFFIVVGYFLSPEGVLPQIAIVNRIVSLLIISVVAYLAHRESLTRKVNVEILDRISDAFIAVDRKWQITYLNRVAQSSTQLKQDVVGKNLWEFFPQLKGTSHETNYRKAMDTQQPVKYRSADFYSSREYEVSIYPSENGITVYSNDISELVKKENELQKTLSQKEMLIKEIHHRVKNNFQLISSLIRLSTIHIENEEIIRTISSIEARIKALSLIHEQLYRGTSGDSVNMKLYIGYLVKHLETLNHQKSISVDIAVDEIKLDIDSAIAVGLIVNEFYSNSVKHGFANSTEGKIIINMIYTNAEKNQINLLYKDNGSGIPEGKNIHESESMGFTIVKTLIEQYHGDYTITNKTGLSYNITLPVSRQ
jgi:two-component sensor histidine kinase/PAS domain-containing protein